MNDRFKELWPYIALVGGIFCIGFSAIFVRLAQTTGDVSAFYRFGFATLALTIPMAIHWGRGKATIKPGALKWALLAGLFFAMDITLYNYAVYLTTASNATIMGNTAPIWVGLGGWLILKERVGPLYWAGLALALLGVLTIVGLDSLRGLGTNPGNLLALGGGVFYAAYQLITRRARMEIDNLSYFWLTAAAGSLVMIVVLIFTQSPLLGLPPRSYLALLGLALLTHTAGWLLLNDAFAHLRAALVSVSLLGQPIMTTLIALPILGEAPRPWHLIGGALVLAGIVVVHRSFMPKPQTLDESPGAADSAAR